MSSSSGITVVVRVRPLNELERGRGDSADGVRCLDERVVSSRDKQFTFDAAFGGPDQAQVFERTEMRSLLEASLQGYAATVFAYGQTGSGKTYTMSGPDVGAEGSGATASATEGIIPRAVRHLFNTLDTFQSSRAGVSYAISASYLEIYNEQINDLLNTSSTGLPIRWHAAQGFFVEGLVMVDCESVDELMLVFQEGTKNRKVGSHLMNKDSSRSHSIMQVQVTSRELIATDEAGDHTVETHGRLSFVDLAGSERLDQSGSVGKGARETAHINTSLLVLGKVISALSAAGDSGRVGHVPYRDSKLTKLLADSLGGSSLAMMIGCISPSSAAVDESNATMHYLSAAKRIQNRPVVQMNQASGMAASLKSLRDEVQGLRMANSSLHQQLSALSASGMLQGGSGRSTPQHGYGEQQGMSMQQGMGMQQGMQQGMGMQRTQSVPEHRHEEMRQRELQAVEQMAAEISHLRRQNAHHSMANHLLQRSYNEVKRENDALQDKLERLERVFVDQDHDAQ